MVVLFALMVLVEVKTPNRYHWEDRTYSHSDEHPFGAKLVDSLLAASVKKGYQVKPGSLKEAYDEYHPDTAILLVNYAFDDYKHDYRYDEVDMLIEMLGEGVTVIIFTDDLGNNMYKNFNVMTSVGKDYDNGNYIEPDSIHFKWKKDSCYDGSMFKFRAFDIRYSIILSANSEDEEFEYEDFGESYVIENDADIKWKELLLTGYYNHEWMAASCNYEGGKLVLVSYPLLFTNYYVLEDGGAQLLMRILSQAGDKPIVRYDETLDEKYIEEENVKSESPLRVFIDHKSLRWAVYLALLGIVISLLFTARRKQRVIPLVEEPKNQTIEMIKHIGLMYYRNHDNASLIGDKYRQLAFELQRKKLIYLEEDDLDEESMKTLAGLAELDAEKLNTLLTRIKTIDNAERINVRDKETKQLIDVMNKILNNM